jgi:hypothetical protein
MDRSGCGANKNPLTSQHVRWPPSRGDSFAYATRHRTWRKVQPRYALRRCCHVGTRAIGVLCPGAAARDRDHARRTPCMWRRRGQRARQRQALKKYAASETPSGARVVQQTHCVGIFSWQGEGFRLSRLLLRHRASVKAHLTVACDVHYSQ